MQGNQLGSKMSRLECRRVDSISDGVDLIFTDRTTWDFYLGLRSDFDPRVLKFGLMGLKETNSRGEYMIRP